MKQHMGYLADSLNAPEIMDNWVATLLDASSSGSIPMRDNWSIKWSNRRFMLVVPFAPSQTRATAKAK
jgi:hypothetical protein